MWITDEDLDKMIFLAQLDLSTLNEYSIQTNPERLERPAVCIDALKKELDFYKGLSEEVQFIIDKCTRPLTYGKPWQAYLPKFMQEWFIPTGDYCYHRSRTNDRGKGVRTWKKCPFWDAYKDSWESMVPGGVPEAYCHYLEDRGMILDDQCKECGIKDDWDACTGTV